MILFQAYYKLLFCMDYSVQRLGTDCTVRGCNPGGNEIFRTRLNQP